MLQPVRRRTWARKGRTPVHYSWDRRDRLSAVSAIAVSPLQCRLGLYFRIHRRNIRSEEVVEFLKILHRHLRRKFILVLDRYSVHRKAVRLLGQEHLDWFEAEWFPAYAPELNPVEQIWNHTKYADLANFIPHDVDHLDREVTNSIANQSDNQPLIRSFFRFAKLGI